MQLAQDAIKSGAFCTRRMNAMRLRGLQTFTQTVGLQAECGVLESRPQVYGELLGCCKASQASRSSLGGAVCVRASPFSLSRALCGCALGRAGRALTPAHQVAQLAPQFPAAFRLGAFLLPEPLHSATQPVRPPWQALRWWRTVPSRAAGWARFGRGTRARVGALRFNSRGGCRAPPQAQRCTMPAYTPSSPSCRTPPHTALARAGRSCCPCGRQRARGSPRPPWAGSPSPCRPGRGA